MNTNQVNTAVTELLWPERTGVPGRTGVPARHARIRRLTAGAWIVASVTQFVVWAMIVVISLDWEAPWWLWTFVPGALVTGLVYWLTELDLQSRPASPVGENTRTP